MRRTLFFVIALILLPAGPSAHAQWTQTNGPFYGNFNDMMNTGSGIILAGTNEGCFSSTDDGTTWARLLSDATYSLSGVSTLTVYAGTSDGLYRSTNSGVDWTKTALPTTGSVRVVESSRTLVFASTSSDGYRSTDGGSGWETLSIGDFNSLAFVSALTVVAATPVGIYRSTNGGANWTKKYSITTGQYVARVTTAAHGDLLAIAYLDASPYHEIFLRSTNGGDTWVGETMNPAAIPVALDESGRYTVVATEFKYDFESIMGGVYRSTNDGHTWDLTLEQPGSMTSLAVLSGGVAFAGSWAGVMRSLDTGKTWSRIDFPISTLHTVYSLAVSLDGNYYAGTTNGVFRSSDNGDSWRPMFTEMKGRKAGALGVTTAGVVFAGFPYGGVHIMNGMWRTTNDGQTWAHVTAGFAAYDYLSMAPLPDGELVLGTDENTSTNDGGVHISSSGGTSWPSEYTEMDSIVYAVATNASGDIMAGMNGGEIALSTSGGVKWTTVSPPYNDDIYALVAAPKARWFAGTEQGILRTTNNGASWDGTTLGLKSTPAKALAVDSSGHVYAGTTNGVYRTTNLGISWAEFNTGLTADVILSVAVDDRAYVLAGTRAGGVFRRPLLSVAVDEGPEVLPRAYELMQNYPNPFNLTTIIRYSVGVVSREWHALSGDFSERSRGAEEPAVSGQQRAVSRVRLAVYDLLGREVAVLVDGKDQPGEHTAVWDAAGTPSGVYVYRLVAGAHVISRKMLLLR